MRAVLLAVLLGAANAGAQVPLGPVVPENAKPKKSSGEFRVAGFVMSGDRAYDFAGNVDSETGGLRGVEVLLRHTAIGLGFRSWTSEFGNQPKVASADARLYLFPPVFSVMLGAGRRATWSELNEDAPSQKDFALLGVSSTAAIGGTGLRTNVSATIMVTAPQEETTGSQPDPSTGLEGEASILYALPKVPIFVQLGYRTEIFNHKNANFDTPEQARGIRLGAGLQLGGR